MPTGSSAGWARRCPIFNGALWLKGLTTNQRAQAKLYLGLAYRSAGLGDQAKKALNEAKKLSPNDKRIASAIGGANVNPERSSGSTIRSFFGRDKAPEPEPEIKTATAPAAPAAPAAPGRARGTGSCRKASGGGKIHRFADPLVLQPGQRPRT